MNAQKSIVKTYALMENGYTLNNDRIVWRNLFIPVNARLAKK